MYFYLEEIHSESEDLHEDFFEYILVSLKAKQDWIPFGNLIR